MVTVTYNSSNLEYVIVKIIYKYQLTFVNCRCLYTIPNIICVSRESRSSLNCWICLGCCSSSIKSPWTEGITGNLRDSLFSEETLWLRFIPNICRGIRRCRCQSWYVCSISPTEVLCIQKIWTRIWSTIW